MKLIKNLVFLIFLFSICVEKKAKIILDAKQCPPYKLIILFSQKIKQETKLILNGYGINLFVPKNYQYKNGIANFRASYVLPKTRKDKVTLEEARNLTVFLVESFLDEINSNLEIIPELDVYPFTSDLIRASIHFEDENRVDLGRGVAIMYLSDGKIRYEGYNIREYAGRYPAVGKHFTIREESYAEALEIVNGQIKK